MTIATVANKQPYCASCYYAFDPQKAWLIFKSSPQTKHIEDILCNPLVAGSILPDKSSVGTIQGIQFSGKAVEATEEFKSAKNIYHSKFPFALAMNGDIWVIQLTQMKFTNNKLGFGKKISWQAE